MSVTQPIWAGRLSIPILVLAHISGSVLGAIAFAILGGLLAAILQIKSEENRFWIIGLSLVAGAILPSVLLWRARNRSVRAKADPSTEEFPLADRRTAERKLFRNTGRTIWRVTIVVLGITVTWWSITSLTWPIKLCIVLVGFAGRVCVQLIRRRYWGHTAIQAPIF
jgi:hypothetical protein